MNNIKLKYTSGNVISEDIHQIGIIALGSHRENHGTALPIDTDSKIAANIALNVATKTGATFLGIFYGATEYDFVKHGIHLKKDDLIKLGEFIGSLKNLKALDVLPYHTMGVNKYKEMGIPYALEGVEALPLSDAVKAKEYILQGIKNVRTKL